jgi:hypothetical protein
MIVHLQACVYSTFSVAPSFFLLFPLNHLWDIICIYSFYIFPLFYCSLKMLPLIHYLYLIYILFKVY